MLTHDRAALSADPEGGAVSSPLQTDGRTRPAIGASSRPRRPTVEVVQKPTLLFFHSPTSGRSRRVEGFLAQVLQRRRNHGTFSLVRVDYEAHADLAARCAIKQPPAIVVVEGKRVRARLESARLRPDPICARDHG